MHISFWNHLDKVCFEWVIGNLVVFDSWMHSSDSHDCSRGVSNEWWVSGRVATPLPVWKPRKFIKNSSTYIIGLWPAVVSRHCPLCTYAFTDTVVVGVMENETFLHFTVIAGCFNWFGWGILSKLKVDTYRTFHVKDRCFRKSLAYRIYRLKQT